MEKKLKYNIYIILIISIFITGCNKKENTDASKITPDTKEEQEKSNPNQNRITELSDYHIVYKLDNEPDMTLEVFKKGTKIRSQSKINKNNITVEASAFLPGDGYVYVVNEVAGKKNGTKMKTTEKTSDDKDYFNLVLQGKEHLKDFEKIGSEEVLDYACDIYQDKNGNKFYFYNDVIMLKFTGKKGSITATKVEPLTTEDESFFDKPDLNYKEVDLKKIKDIMKVN